MNAELELLGGGADAAALLLARYDVATDRWEVPKEGDFWDAVGSAHDLGREGAGKRVAVIDGGFDLSIPALSGQALRFAQGDGVATAHGTVVALLVREVAPAASLDLYPVSVDGKLNPDRVIAAIADCVNRGVDVINLSLGAGIAEEAVSTLTAGMDGASPGDPVRTPNPAYASDALDPDDWRTIFDIPESPLWRAAFDAANSGVTIVASTGNYAGTVYVPAATPGVIAAGFLTVERLVSNRLEEAAAKPPSFVQSRYADLQLLQPADVLGSSFASPLIAAFATLMADRTELPDYVRCSRRAANASGALRLLQEGESANSDFLMLTDSLFKEALASAPHKHYDEDVYSITHCPECALFANPAYNDFGLFTMSTGNVDIAVRLFASLRQIAPTNPYAAANLGVAFAMLAQAAKDAGDLERTRYLLEAAVGHTGDAVGLRPGYAPYATRLAEFEGAQADPTKWTLAR